MQKILHLVRLLAVAVLLIAPAPDGHSAEQLDFGVFDNEPQLAAWLDLAPLMSSTRVDNIHDGIDLVIDFQLTLKRPRRLWGAETIEVKGGDGENWISNNHRGFCSPDGRQGFPTVRQIRHAGRNASIPD